ncbi:enoyl-CoA hydratase/isomerase family protein [Phytohabitans sp. ZYX-F-186]|uniref:Enoyl-CoA hydratase/isomerase family protein n=1 Tax=Phytohabitans maris TaxID=3071409 RepID=A0ABU0ZKA0_9ACTN|nr:enoyl-CoA hydratase/isomerase family protein [Phytohabitans sp. ZYX-F-186]MDQ7907482.1 enoyl-CoA hydratase/isomerase family protein [Phytohabitans sp. ZYX-F-186]
MPHFTEIKTSVENGVGRITFDRLDRRNALSLELFADVSDCLDAWRDDDGVACVVLTGGEDVFCAGLDLALQSVFDDKSKREAYSKACMRAYGTLLDYPKPTVAAVAGPALGGGCDIAVFCDIRIGATNAVMGYPQIKMGLTPYFSPLWRIVGLSQAKLLTFSGDKVDAAEALRIGLLDRLVEAGTVVRAATALAESIAQTSTESAMNNKEMALRAPAMDPISALTYETLAYREIIWHPEVVARVGAAYDRIRSAP